MQSRVRPQVIGFSLRVVAKVGFWIFGGQDTPIVLGLGKYPPRLGKILSGPPQVRAISGGTGRHFGARGKISTIFRGDGTYQHLIRRL